MNQQRIAQLLAFVEQEPQNPFNLYALALEYRADKPQQAGLYFDRLLTDFPDYLPTYYHAAAFYAAQDEPEKAAKLYDLGLELARKEGNPKAEAELLRAQQAFDDEQDDW